MSSSVKVVIDSAALTHNLRVARQYAPHSKLFAVIKDNAYGHGLLRGAVAMRDADGFAVTEIEDAVLLRQVFGVDKRILLLHGFNRSSDLGICMAHQLDCVIHAPWQLSALRDQTLQGKLSIWIKVNTGMNRLGFRPTEVAKIWDACWTWPGVNPVGLMTHLACADDDTHSLSREQWRQLMALDVGKSPVISVANSAGVLAWPGLQGDWVRPGLMLYGVSPFPDRSGADFGLKPAMTVMAPIVALQALQPGDGVGYGLQWVCEIPTIVGVVNMGYGQGYPRRMATGTPLWVNGQEVPLVGRVSMDLLTVDLGDPPKATVGDWVECWGEHLPLERVSRHCAGGAIPYEWLTGVRGVDSENG